jgi:NAD(P)-dependent dehydrogenase (short-subunit alcohol dehydrogenase family)
MKGYTSKAQSRTWLLRTIFEFRAFDNIYAMTGGGPANSTMVLSMFTYLLSDQHHVRGALPDPDDPDRCQCRVGSAEPDDLLTDPMVDHAVARIEQQLPAQRANDGSDHHWYDQRSTADADPRQADVEQQRDTKSEDHFRCRSGRRVDEGYPNAASEDWIAQQILIVLQPDIAAAKQSLALCVTCEAEIEREGQRHSKNAKHHRERWKDRRAREIAIERDAPPSPCRARRRSRYRGVLRELAAAKFPHLLSSPRIRNHGTSLPLQHVLMQHAVQSPCAIWPYVATSSPTMKEEEMSERRRAAIVTGAAGGIGRELVLGLLDKGLRIAAVDRTAQGLAELTQAAQEGQRGVNLLTIEADLAGDEAIDEIVAKTRGRFGVIDILVNNAGVGQATIRSDNRQRPIKFWEVTPELWKLFVAVHNNAPMALSRAVVHDMMRQKWGRIVNITTSLGTMIREGSPTYGPSKAALEAFSAIMAKDLAGTGVTVNVLVPGGVTNTGMVPLEAGYDRAEMIQPGVMAPPLNWLVSDAAAGVTGRRFLAVHWDPSLPPEEAAAKAGAPVAWTDIATMPIEPPRRH